MAFEDFLHKPYDEYQLLCELSQEIKNNYSMYHGQNYHLHLQVAGEMLSMIDDVRSTPEASDLWEYTYVERDHQARILIRSDEGQIMILLCGEYVFAEHKVSPSGIIVTEGPTASILPTDRISGLSSLELMAAFGMINNSLQKSVRNKS